MATEGMQFLWRDWRTLPVSAAGLSPRVEALLYPDRPREPTGSPLPERECRAAGGEYAVKEGRLFLIGDTFRVPVAEEIGPISSVALSSDLWRLYIASRDKVCVYVASVGEDGLLSSVHPFASLRTRTDFSYPGATDLWADGEDRVFAATELGVQCIPFLRVGGRDPSAA